MTPERRTLDGRLSLRLLGCLWMALSLGGCDGGLFGTGDGSANDADIEPPSSVSLPDTDEGTPPDDTTPNDPAAPAPADADTNEPDASEPDPDQPPVNPVAPTIDPEDTADGDAGNRQSFDNMLATTRQVQPLLRLVNLTGMPLAVENGPVATDIPADDGSGGLTFELELGVNRFGVDDSPSAGRQVTIDPLNVAAYSLTTVVAWQTPTELRLTPLTTQTTVAEGMARLRIAVPPMQDIDFAQQPAPIALQPEGAEGSEAQFPAAAVPVSEYQMVTPGQYRVQRDPDLDTAARITLQAGRVYTLVLDVPDAGEAVLIDDSELR